MPKDSTPHQSDKRNPFDPLTINPHEQKIRLIVSIDGRQRQHRQSTHEHCSLTQILSRNSALNAVLHNKQPEDAATNDPRAAQVNLQHQNFVAQLVGRNLMRQVEQRRVDSKCAEKKKFNNLS